MFQGVGLQLVKHRPRGQAMAEYGLMLALFIVIMIATLTLFGQNITGSFTGMANRILQSGPGSGGGETPTQQAG